MSRRKWSCSAWYLVSPNMADIGENRAKRWDFRLPVVPGLFHFDLHVNFALRNRSRSGGGYRRKCRLWSEFGLLLRIDSRVVYESSLTRLARLAPLTSRGITAYRLTLQWMFIGTPRPNCTTTRMHSGDCCFCTLSPLPPKNSSFVDVSGNEGICLTRYIRNSRRPRSLPCV